MRGSLFPPIGELTYLLTLPPYGFYWFLLATASDWPHGTPPAPEPMPEFMTIVLRKQLADADRDGRRRRSSSEMLPQYSPSAAGSP